MSDKPTSEACYLCGAESYTRVDTQADLRYFPDDVFRIMRCNACGLLYTLPKLDQAGLAKYYPSNYGAYGDDVQAIMARFNPNRIRLGRRDALYGRWLYQEIHGRFPANLPARAINTLYRLRYLVGGVYKSDRLIYSLPVNGAPGNYLHVGAGTGGLYMLRLQQGWQVSAIDVNEELMRQWREHSPVKAFGQGIKQAEFDEGSFDVIFLSHVIEHLTDPVAEMGILARWLKPDGVLVCQLPLYGTFGWNLRRKYVYYDVPRHTIHFTSATLKKLLAAAGLEIRKTLVTPYSYGFYFSDFKRHALTGRPGNFVANDRPTRLHRLLEYPGWLLNSSGNICIYAVRAPET